jgi:hypothetical protein
MSASRQMKGRVRLYSGNALPKLRQESQAADLGPHG